MAKSLWQQHIDRFGVEPVVTGVNAFSPDEIDTGIMRAIATGVPYVEPDLPDGAIA